MLSITIYIFKTNLRPLINDNLLSAISQVTDYQELKTIYLSS